MNPIVKMMKRYINMPLKKALPLLFIGALVLSATTGCTTNTATPTPTVQATAMQTPAATTTQGSGSNNELSLTVTPKGEATTIGVLSKADNGSKFVLYNAVLKNINVKNLDVNPFWFDMRLSNGSS